jgi:hypothetical protein
MVELNRSDLPPDRKEGLFLRRLKAKQKTTVMILSRTLWGCFIHWDGKRSSPCIKLKALCDGCRAGKPKRWRAYLHVYDLHNRKEEFLELTEGAARQLLDQLPAGIELRGERVQFERLAGDQARVHVTALIRVDLPEWLPVEKSPLKTLCDLWGVKVTTTGDPEAPLLPNEPPLA